jgi:hypothetical protein
MSSQAIETYALDRADTGSDTVRNVHETFLFLDGLWVTELIDFPDRSVTLRSVIRFLKARLQISGTETQLPANWL